MVFRGTPSKACGRCRVRRLKCDLRREGCSSCARARVSCTGYRDTQQLRIRNESQSVARKALKNATPLQPRFLPVSIDLQARVAFFTYYLTSRCWDFLKPYHHPTDAPEHLTLAIEAVSLAYLWHQVDSETALAAARRRYISALRMTNKTLETSKGSTKDTTLLASFLLDLFEKITDAEPRNNKAWTSHVSGALILVNHRGLEKFQDPDQLLLLVRLSSNYIIGSIGAGLPVPNELHAIQAYIGKKLGNREPTLRLLDLMVQYANLCSNFRQGVLPDNESMWASMELDCKFQALEVDLPPSWQYSTIFLDHQSARAFDLHLDFYSNPRICQARNFLRVVRIMLNQSMIEHYSSSHPTEKLLRLTVDAQNAVEALAREICASVPQYVDCNIKVQPGLPESEKSVLLEHTHRHTHNDQLECHCLIFPLYVAGMCNAVPSMRSWIINQLNYIGSHFYIRKAKVVAEILEREVDSSPWDVYALLGSYAFTC